MNTSCLRSCSTLSTKVGSPPGRPWPRGRPSLAWASKPTNPQKRSFLGSRTALFFDWLKRKITKQTTT